jgi:hypothetical protein
MVPHFNRFIKQVDIAVTLYTRILQVLGSILGQDTGFPDRFISVCLSPFRKIRDNTWSESRRLPFEPFPFISSTNRQLKYSTKSFTSLFLCMEIMIMARVAQEAEHDNKQRLVCEEAFLTSDSAVTATSPADLTVNYSN